MSNKQTLTNNLSLSFGISSDTNRRYRRRMEDTHIIVHEDIPNSSDKQAFCAIFDGHAGKAVSEYCEKNFWNVFKKYEYCLRIYLYLLNQSILLENPSKPMNEIFETTYSQVESGIIQNGVKLFLSLLDSILRKHSCDNFLKNREKGWQRCG